MSPGIDEPCDGRAGAGACLEGREVWPPLGHEVEVFGFIHQVSGGEGKGAGKRKGAGHKERGRGHNTPAAR